VCSSVFLEKHLNAESVAEDLALFPCIVFAIPSFHLVGTQTFQLLVEDKYIYL